jgi:hypothetical protein
VAEVLAGEHLRHFDVPGDRGASMRRWPPTGKRGKRSPIG